MAATVERIIELIELLPAEDQATLEERLAERAEAAWQAEAESARPEAKLARQNANARGLDQGAIN